MTKLANSSDRCAVIAALVDSAEQPFGRTALMKFMYFLQVIKEVPLGYHFTLYTYGPFDSKALYDLEYAESLNAVRSEIKYNPNGYGYEINKGDLNAIERIKTKGQTFIAENQASIEWVIQTFATYSPAQLELLSTIIYADREAKAKEETLSLEKLTEQVLKVKPRFSSAQGLQYARALEKENLLHSLALGQIPSKAA